MIDLLKIIGKKHSDLLHQLWLIEMGLEGNLQETEKELKKVNEVYMILGGWYR